jgi:hypothetical protein
VSEEIFLTFVVAYRLPLLSRSAWNTIRVEAQSPMEAVKMTCMEIPCAQIEDVWRLDDLQTKTPNQLEQIDRPNLHG